MSLNTYIAKQFADPKGFGGSVISLVMNRQNRPLYDETIRLLAPSDSDSILDIGCGNGFMLNLLGRNYNATFAGIDPSKEIIGAAVRRNHKYVKHNNMSFSCQDVSSMSFPGKSFSKAYTVNTVYFWSELNTPMLEIKRVLMPKGIFINTLYTDETLSRFSHTQYGYRRYKPDELVEAGKSAGLTVKTVPILHGTAVCYIYTKEKE